MIDLLQLKPTDQISPNLRGSEILNASTFKIEDKPVIDSRLFQIFEIVRSLSGKTPIRINSAFRNFVPKGGSKNSAHLRGYALDFGMTSAQISLLRFNLPEFLKHASNYGLSGLGIYPWGIHVDTDPNLPKNNIYKVSGSTIPYRLRHWAVDVSPWLISVTSSQALSVKHDGLEHNDEQPPDSNTKYFVIAILAYFTFKAFL